LEVLTINLEFWGWISRWTL